MEIVVDTNVLKQADDEASAYNAISTDFVAYLITSDEKLCMDDGYDPTNAENCGFIGREYVKHIIPGMQAYNLLMMLLTLDRVVFFSRNVPAAIKKKINQTGIKPADRKFVEVAYNANSRILVTHDYEDFKDRIRKIIKKEIGVAVVRADEYLL